MSQYPSPYQPYNQSPVGYYAGAQHSSYQQLLGRFIRASTMLFVTGGLLILLGVSCAGIGSAVDWNAFRQQLVLQGQTLPPELTDEILRASAIVSGAMMLIFGIAEIVLAVFVRKGGLVSTILAIVITSLLLLILAYPLIAGLLNPKAAGSPANLIVTMFILAVPFVLAVLQFVWLSMAAKSHGPLQAAKAQYTAQYWQYVQAQQGYAQPQYGTPRPPPGQPPITGFGGTAGAPIPPPPPPPHE